MRNPATAKIRHNGPRPVSCITSPGLLVSHGTIFDLAPVRTGDGLSRGFDSGRRPSFAAITSLSVARARLALFDIEVDNLTADLKDPVDVLARARRIVDSGATIILLLALSDSGHSPSNAKDTGVLLAQISASLSSRYPS